MRGVFGILSIVCFVTASAGQSSARQAVADRPRGAIDEAPQRGWTVVDMKRDWKVIYPFQK